MMNIRSLPELVRGHLDVHLELENNNQLENGGRLVDQSGFDLKEFTDALKYFL